MERERESSKGSLHQLMTLLSWPKGYETHWRQSWKQVSLLCSEEDHGLFQRGFQEQTLVKSLVW